MALVEQFRAALMRELSRRHLSQSAFAKLLDVTPQYVSGLLHGKSGIGLPTVSKICNALEVDIEDLLRNEPTSHLPEISDECKLRCMNITDDQTKAAFSANVLRELQARGKNIHWLMNVTGEFSNRIYPAVNGKTMPGAGLVARVAAALDVPVDDLLKPIGSVDESSTVLEEIA